MLKNAIKFVKYQKYAIIKTSYLLIIKNMSKKNFLFVAIVSYVAWSIVSSLFNNKKWDEVVKELNEAKISWKCPKKVLFYNFLENQKKLFSSIKSKLMTPENSAKLEEIKVKWTEYLENAKVKVEALYEENKDKIDSFKNNAPEHIKGLKDKLIAKFEELKTKIK